MVDPADPHTIVVSVSQSAWQAHSVEGANSLVYILANTSSSTLLDHFTSC